MPKLTSPEFSLPPLLPIGDDIVASATETTPEVFYIPFTGEMFLSYE